MMLAKTEKQVKELLIPLLHDFKLAQITHEKSTNSDILSMSIVCYYPAKKQNESD